MIGKLFGSKKNSGDKYADKGIIKHNRGEFPEAIDDLEKALELGLSKYSIANVSSVLGYCYQYVNRFQKAIDCQKAALENDNEYLQAWVGLGMAYRKLDNFEEAEKCYEKGLMISPENPELLASLGALYIFTGRNQQAIEVLEKSIALNPSFAVAHANLSIAYATEKRLDDAELALENAVRYGYQNHKPIQAQINSIRNYHGQEKPQKTRDYEELLPQVLRKLYPSENDREQVVNIISKYQSREPYRVHLGIIKASNGNIDEMERFAQLAVSDFRDLLCAAEYPLSWKQWGLKEKDPLKYAELKRQEYEEYEEWLRSILES